MSSNCFAVVLVKASSSAKDRRKPLPQVSLVRGLAQARDRGSGTNPSRATALCRSLTNPSSFSLLIAGPGAAEDIAARAGITSSVEVTKMLVRRLAFGLRFGVTPSDRGPSNDRLLCTIGNAACRARLRGSRSFSFVARYEWWRCRRIGDEISDMERVI